MHVPPLFRELAAAGRFDYWGTSEALDAEQRAELVAVRETEVLWWDGIEWDRSVEDVESYDGDGVLRPGLVPFAGNGVGDHYCWYEAWQSGEEPPVVLVEHDSLTSRVFAPDLAGCLVRCLLQHVATHEFGTDGDRAALWTAHRRILDPHLGPQHRHALDQAGGDPERCRAADEELAAADRRELVALLQPTRFDTQWLSVEDALRAYERSVAFYEELVETEGRQEHAGALAEVRRNRDSLTGSASGRS